MMLTMLVRHPIRHHTFDFKNRSVFWNLTVELFRPFVSFNFLATLVGLTGCVGILGLTWFTNGNSVPGTANDYNNINPTWHAYSAAVALGALTLYEFLHTAGLALSLLRCAPGFSDASSYKSMPSPL